MIGAYTVLLLAAITLVLAHVVLPSPAVRPRIVGIIGESVYLGLFSLIAAASIIAMVWAYILVPLDFLWVPGSGLRLIPLVTMPVAFFFTIASVLVRNPASAGMEDQLQAESPARGVVRITRHPMLWGTVFWALAHIAANGDLGSLIFFGGFLSLSVVGMIGIDRKRVASHGDAWKRFTDTTSCIPFAAILKGKNRLVLSEIGWIPVIVTVASYAVLLMIHNWLFGVPPY